MTATSRSELYVICWRSSATGKSGRGTKRLDSATADKWVDKLNKDFPDLRHWKEREMA